MFGRRRGIPGDQESDEDEQLAWFRDSSGKRKIGKINTRSSKSHGGGQHEKHDNENPPSEEESKKRKSSSKRPQSSKEQEAGTSYHHSHQVPPNPRQNFAQHAAPGANNAFQPPRWQGNPPRPPAQSYMHSDFMKESSASPQYPKSSHDYGLPATQYPSTFTQPSGAAAHFGNPSMPYATHQDPSYAAQGGDYVSPNPLGNSNTGRDPLPTPLPCMGTQTSGTAGIYHDLPNQHGEPAGHKIPPRKLLPSPFANPPDGNGCPKLQTIAMRKKDSFDEEELEEMWGNWYVCLPEARKIRGGSSKPLLLHYVEERLTFYCYCVGDQNQSDSGARGVPRWLQEEPKTRLYICEMNLWFDGYQVSNEGPPTLRDDTSQQCPWPLYVTSERLWVLCYSIGTQNPHQTWTWEQTSGSTCNYDLVRYYEVKGENFIGYCVDDHGKTECTSACCNEWPTRKARIWEWMNS